MYIKEIEKIEKKFNVILPNSRKATYSSILNYSNDLDKPFQRWYRYKEGYSLDIVYKLIDEYCENRKGLILDPFVGSGTTLLASSKLGLSGIGYETNPFSFFLAKCKLDNYSKNLINEFENIYCNLLSDPNISALNYELPKLSISNKVFDQEIEKYYMGFKVACDAFKKKTKIYNLLLLGWLACLEEVSNYRKAGNGLKIKKYKKQKKKSISDIKSLLRAQYSNMVDDLRQSKSLASVKLFNDSSLNILENIAKDSVSGIIFSPPYANCFDYTEIYKLELWFGDFVNDYSDLKTLRQNSIRSNLNNPLLNDFEVDSKLFNVVLNVVDNDLIWDKRIPKMLKSYYLDMFNIISNCYEVLEKGGFCSIIVGNSAYGGVVFPTDLILAEYAEKIGFYVDKIEVDRYIITSSQQYEATKNARKFLRESVVCLIKK